MATTQTRTRNLREFFGLPPMETPEFSYQAALYWLDSGHYLFRTVEREGIVSKFVTAPDVAAAFAGQESDTNWIAPNVMRCGYGKNGAWFVYYIPMQKTTIQVDKESLTIPLPPMVLIGSGKKYYLRAMREKHFAPNTQLYHAPFPNVYTDGGLICWGNIHPPEATQNHAEKVWQTFLGSRFNGDLAGGKSAKQGEDIRLQLRALAEKKASAYPPKDMVPVKYYDNTTEKWLEKVLKGE